MGSRLTLAGALVAVLASGCSVQRSGALPQDGGQASPETGTGMDGCTSRPERCNGRDDDCDGAVDEDFDLRADPSNCGACDNACELENAAAACRDGSCAIDACTVGYADCDGVAANGCEAWLGHPDHCGSCETGCEEPTPLCDMAGESIDGAPEFACVDDCSDGEDDCDGSCVDLADSAEHCGECGNRCPSPRNAIRRCESSTCGFECQEGFDDCDEGEPGCETDITTAESCGSCGTTCDLDNAIAACGSGGNCRLDQCLEDWGDCDDDPENGCETSLTTVEHCGECGNGCSYDNAIASCEASGCAMDTCEDGFADCDDDESTGCETDLRTSDEHCGMCGDPCDEGETCDDGSCFCEVLDCSESDCRCAEGCHCSYHCSDDCAPLCEDEGTRCLFDVDEAETVDRFECRKGAHCRVDASGSDTFIATCKDERTSCAIDCTGANNCEPKCEHDARCGIDCRDTNNCDEVECKSGAECVLDCTDAGDDCEYKTCHDEVVDCGDDVFVCGRPCP